MSSLTLSCDICHSSQMISLKAQLIPKIAVWGWGLILRLGLCSLVSCVVIFLFYSFLCVLITPPSKPDSLYAFHLCLIINSLFKPAPLCVFARLSCVKVSALLPLSCSDYMVLGYTAWVTDLILSNDSGWFSWTNLQSKFNPPDQSVIGALLKSFLSGIEPVWTSPSVSGFQQIPSVQIKKRMFILMVNSTKTAATS